MKILVEKSIFHFITKMNLFCGGNFLKRSLGKDPLEAYIFIFWFWKAPICQLDSHPGCHSIKPVNWTAILAATQSNQATGQPSWQSLNRRRQRRRRRRFPKNSGIWAEPWSNVPRNQISRAGNPSLRRQILFQAAGLSSLSDLCMVWIAHQM